LCLPMSATIWKGNFMGAIKPHRPNYDKVALAEPELESQD
jgi:hypothetical protein